MILKIAGTPKYFVCVTLLLLLATEAFGQADIISGSISTSATNYSPGSGANRLIVVCIGNERSNSVRTVTGITWGGQSLEHAQSISVGNDNRGEIWYLTEAKINAAASYCNDFVVDWSNTPSTVTFSAFTLKNVDQSAIVNDVAAAQATNDQITATNIAAGGDDIVVYVTVNQNDETIGHAANYTEITFEGGAMAMATAYRKITGVGGNQSPAVDWSGGNVQTVIVGVSFNGVANTAGTTYYSIGSGAWNSNTVWSLTSGGTAVAAGVWPQRSDNVVIASPHNITVDATNDNKACGVTPISLGYANVGAFAGSGTTTFYHTGNITINSGGTLTATVPVMLEGTTTVNGNFPVTGDLTNLGALTVSSTGNMDISGNLNLSGSSTTTLNNVGSTTATVGDDINLDYTNATLCGTGQLRMGLTGASPEIVRTNGALLTQICSGLTVICNCSASTGNRGPGGVGKIDGTSTLELWFDSRDFNGNGTNPANGTITTAWQDKSGNNIDVTSNVAGVASYGATGVTFNNVGYMAASDATLPMGSNARTAFVCASSPSTDADDVLFTYGEATDDQSFGILKIQNDDGTVANRNGIRSFFYNNDFNVPGGFTPSGSMKVITASYRPNTQTVYVNGTSSTRTPGTPNTTSGGADGLNIGGWTSFSLFSQATIAEVILLSEVNTAQIHIINNYLAAKNGVAMSANDLYTQDNNGFDYEMIGIGKAADGEHLDARGSGIVRFFTLNISGAMASGEYLMAGHDNGSITVTAKTVGTEVDGTTIKERLPRIWAVTETGDVGAISVQFDLASYPGTPLAQNLRLLIDRDGDGFADNDVTPISGATYQNDLVTFSNVNFISGDRFTLGNTDLAHPLPIRLLSFMAKAERSVVKLDWATASETNNDFFTIERSKDGRQWDPIQEVDGSGTTNEKKTYQAVDDGPLKGYAYYRLKQTDFDLKHTYSAPVGVYIEYKQITLHPNPSADGIFYVNAPFEAAPENVRVMGISGQHMNATISRDGDRIVVDGSQLPAGVYLLQISDGLVRQHVRFVRK